MFRSCALLMFSLILTGCVAMEPAIPGSGKLVTENRKAGEFTKLEVAIPTRLVVKKGAEPSIELAIDDNLQSLVTTEIKDGVLVVRSEKNIAPHSETTLTIVTPALSSVQTAGSVEGSIEELTGPETNLAIAGSGELTVGLASESFSGSVAGAGTVVLTGSCKKLVLVTSGSGDWDSVAVPAEDVEVRIAGSGSSKVNASSMLSLNIAGSGDVQYAGQPEIKKSIAGSGSVEPIKAANPSKPADGTQSTTPAEATSGKADPEKAQSEPDKDAK
ncbi:MAG: head GIN domain-containing protein [Planctomycetaceae bacterium]